MNTCCNSEREAAVEAVEKMGSKGENKRSRFFHRLNTSNVFFSLEARTKSITVTKMRSHGSIYVSASLLKRDGWKGEILQRKNALKSSFEKGQIKHPDSEEWV